MELTVLHNGDGFSCNWQEPQLLIKFLSRQSQLNYEAIQVYDSTLLALRGGGCWSYFQEKTVT